MQYQIPVMDFRGRETASDGSRWPSHVERQQVFITKLDPEKLMQDLKTSGKNAAYLPWIPSLRPLRRTSRAATSPSSSATAASAASTASCCNNSRGSNPHFRFSTSMFDQPVEARRPVRSAVVPQLQHSIRQAQRARQRHPVHEVCARLRLKVGKVGRRKQSAIGIG